MVNEQATSQKYISADVEKILLSEDEIKSKVVELGQQISKDFQNSVSSQEPLIVIGILKGVIVFLADLMREIDLPLELHFIDIESQSAGTRETGLQELDSRIQRAIQGKHVLFVEDIIDAGLSCSYMTRLLWQYAPASISVCTLLSKESNRMMDIDIRYVGFNIQPLYVVGYGLDNNELYRNLPFIGLLSEHAR
ncbi:MAG: hypoxanthine phosphoribosyltransferase [Chloroflexota bacterium]